MNEHYSVVLTDLRGRRMKLEAELRDVDAAINGIQRLLGGNNVQGLETMRISAQPSLRANVVQEQSFGPEPHSRFANISVRWGVLWHLAEDVTGYEKTGEIASALLAGGYKSEAVRFPNLVSAVLSSMKAKGEVETSDDGGGYRLTDAGRQTWSLIKQGAKLRAAISATEPQLLSVR